jgi:glucans biosynthesis protein
MSNANYIAGVIVGAILLVARMGSAFSLDDVAVRARQLAQAPYDDATDRVPQWLLDITYDEWRDIRFRPSQSLWRGSGLPFEAQFFHPGLYFPHRIRINVVDGGAVEPLHSSTKEFDYGKNKFVGRIPDDLGYAGFRLHYPLNRPEYLDELIVFLGASYFRALARGQVYGLSARGIAVDTVASKAEEFPYFREFWLIKPAADAKRITLYALLDGPSVTGAYRLEIEPGDATTVGVECRLYLRRKVEKLGIAPLTSMFFHGEDKFRPIIDYRPEVHDSDGLLLQFDTGEWLWRPLQNPRSTQISVLQMKSPKGFGLLQRDRNFDHHQDLETRTDLRPSVWIETRGDWGAGHVELMQLPTNTDINDNIVSYWVPATQPGPGEAATFAYTMHWYGENPQRPPGGRVVATRRDNGNIDGAQRFVLDFEGGRLQSLGAEQVPKGVVTVADDSATVLDEHIVKNPVTGGWRLAFQIRPKKNVTVELRAFLERDGAALTETWSYGIEP